MNKYNSLKAELLRFELMIIEVKSYFEPVVELPDAASEIPKQC